MTDRAGWACAVLVVAAAAVAAVDASPVADAAPVTVDRVLEVAGFDPGPSPIVVYVADRDGRPDSEGR